CPKTSPGAASAEDWRTNPSEMMYGSRCRPPGMHPAERLTMADKLTVRRRARYVKALSIGIALGAVLAPEVARAQNKAFYLDRLFMAGAPDDAIGMWRPQMGEQTRFFGQFGLGLAYEPFRVRNEVSPTYALERGSYPTPVKFQAEAYADVGVEI